MRKIKIYDTTLRDGMQAEGISFSVEDKLLIARKLDDFGIDYIEGGYPQSNPKEEEFFACVRQIPFRNAKLTAFGSTRRAQTKIEDDICIRALLASGAPAVTMVGKTWDLHVTDVLRCSLDENIAMCAESIAYVKKQGREVLFDAEHFFDGYKNNPDYAMKVLQAAAEAGADALVLCETNGGCLPHEVFDITQTVCRTFTGIEVGIHCHNDSDCAAANSLAAVRAGAVHVQGTINGLGERTGNANLCTIIPNLSLKMGYETVGSEQLKTLTEVSRFVFEIANLPLVTQMPYVGESAFAHKAGLHIDALRKNKKTYEHISPEAVGNERRFLISELSGSSNVLDRLEKRKIITDKAAARKILNRVQELENQGYQFETAEASFELLVKKELGTYRRSFDLLKYHIDVERSPDGKMITEATVKLQVDGKTEHVVSEGDGPVNALDGALRKALEPFYPQLRDMTLIDYKVRVVNARAGTAARVRVIIESRDKDGSVFGTVGVSENIIEASWLALVDSVEYKLLKAAEKLEQTV
ncbi:MAG TPA: citramalate synthase [Anaerohalosphaeraceae bacterium]|nr:citramalate synthase [Phycisphaerae bacterium]HOK96621.1 citramalate synthase [Anaerohalosphaeraceae bacterium]HOL31911.1 citramalate synthase [Anaerohalosphaeraceae bacterium]HOM74921.1 citramalate synthase [Anaerohalosphaeraceae bacterium]HPC63883.1 citramalate synthase [Anaerohalosphaeraceae bacterium]